MTVTFDAARANGSQNTATMGTRSNYSSSSASDDRVAYLVNVRERLRRVEAGLEELNQLKAQVRSSMHNSGPATEASGPASRQPTALCTDLSSIHEAFDLQEQVDEMRNRSQARTSALQSLLTQQSQMKELAQAISQTFERYGNSSTTNSIPAVRSHHTEDPSTTSTSDDQDGTTQRMFQRLQRMRLPAESAHTGELTLREQDQMASITMEATTTLVTAPCADACCICLDAMSASQAVRRLGCSHCMHATCLVRWLRGKDSCVCPLCLQTSSKKR